MMQVLHYLICPVFICYSIIGIYDFHHDAIHYALNTISITNFEKYQTVENQLKECQESYLQKVEEVLEKIERYNPVNKVKTSGTTHEPTGIWWYVEAMIFYPVGSLLAAMALYNAYNFRMNHGPLWGN